MTALQQKASEKPNWFDKILVLSLPCSSDRRQHVRHHFAKNGITNYEFFDASSPDDGLVTSLYENNLVTAFPNCFRCGQLECGSNDCNNTLIKSQVAVFATYLRLWDHLATNNLNALVFEDDVQLNPWFRDTLKKLAERIRSDEIVFDKKTPCLIRLGWALDSDHSEKLEFRYNREIRMSNPCHAINAPYAKALIDEFSGINHTVDVYQHKLARVSETNSITVFPPIAHELSWSHGLMPSLIRPKKNHLKFLQESGEVTQSKEYERLLDNQIEHMFHRKILTVGHPRCGSGFAANVMRQLSLDIGHEDDGRDGIASWMFAADGMAPFYKSKIAKTRKALVWDLLIHHVRDISTAIPSIMLDNQFSPSSYEYRRIKILDRYGFDLNKLGNNFERAVASFIYWNCMIEEMQPDFVFSIENDLEDLKKFLSEKINVNLENITINQEPVNANKPYNGKVHQKPHISPEDWASLGDELWRGVTDFCCKYGYKLPERRKLKRLEIMSLDPLGWTKSKIENKPITQSGHILPWFTYSSIDFISKIIRPTDIVFEYGSGYSTLWWQDLAAKIYSVEHDSQWFHTIKTTLNDNVDLRLVPLDKTQRPATNASKQFFNRVRKTDWPHYDKDKVTRRGLNDAEFLEYASSILEHSTKFDVVVIDGMARRLCTELAITRIKDDGIIILDNSNRSDYDAAFNILNEAQFRQIPFYGFVPGQNFQSCTSVFLKSMERLPPASFSPSYFQSRSNEPEKFLL